MREAMYKNRIRGGSVGRSGPLTAKPIAIQDAKRKFGGCAQKAVELISGTFGERLKNVGALFIG